ncbi:MAG: HipA domain-containing protein [Oligoflexia bacterium]|nr:HipA domain-containing protein [Oligoflexia bacterium]
MNSIRCLGCYKPLQMQISGNYHSACSKRLFGTDVPPKINFGIGELEALALKSLNQHLGLTGVQAKISVHVEKATADPTHRLMIVDLWGNFILKPPTKQFPEMSVLEDVTMHMAQVCGLKVAKHGLVELKSGELAYVTKRFDRPKKGKKVAVEDFCQLSGLLTESKYSSSLEKAGKIIFKYSSNSGLDIIAFFDLILFSFVTGNSDMHLKNFSLMRSDEDEIVLAPFYDLLATKLLIPEDKEEMALTINAKKSKIKRQDFMALAKNFNIPDIASEKCFKRILKKDQEMKQLINESFLSSEMKEKYLSLVDERLKTLSSCSSL